MDSSDTKEKPWGRLGQLVLLVLAIGLIYGILRFAVFIPEWGWPFVTGGTTLGVAVFVLLSFGKGRKPRAAPEAASPAQKTWRAVLVSILVLGLALPLWVLLYFVWLGGQLWK